MTGATIIDAVRAVTKHWAKQRKAEERNQARESRRRSALTRDSHESVKDAAYRHMPAAYFKASSDGTLPAGARQIMYAARGPIQDDTGVALDDKYFTKTLVPQYLRDHPRETADWDVVFDARGHFHEPHTGRSVSLGTLDVRRYLAEGIEPNPPVSGSPLFLTHGPRNRFGGILFIEKELYGLLFDAAKLPERYDIAWMSTKGMSVTAARHLVDRLCGEHGIPLFVLRDFDIAGFSIAGTLRRSTVRYRFRNKINVIDLGLRLPDVQEHGLESEFVSLGRRSRQKLRRRLEINGATEEEIQFLLEGRRVELNAFSSGQLISWIESKLVAHNVTKIIPSEDVLTAAYRAARRRQYVTAKLRGIEAAADRVARGAAIPAALRGLVESALQKAPAHPWDGAVNDIARSKDA